jgi:hypothetical protein
LTNPHHPGLEPEPEEPSLQDMATEVYSVSTTAMTTTMGAGHARPLPPYFKFHPGSYQALAQFSAPVMGPLATRSHDDDIAESEEYRLPKPIPPWLADGEYDSEDDVCETPGSDLTDDYTHDLSSEALKELEELRSKLRTKAFSWKPVHKDLMANDYFDQTSASEEDS